MCTSKNSRNITKRGAVNYPPINTKHVRIFGNRQLLRQPPPKLHNHVAQYVKVMQQLIIFSGNVSVGNLPKFLPFVLSEIEKQPRRQYLLLHSLKEVSINPLYTILLHMSGKFSFRPWRYNFLTD